MFQIVFLAWQHAISATEHFEYFTERPISMYKIVITQNYDISNRDVSYAIWHTFEDWWDVPDSIVAGIDKRYTDMSVIDSRWRLDDKRNLDQVKSQ